ncbi:procathepsin L-like [Planococcus citri]|uniref:procathepsin L-like n=1 Tax=Planococcus citri TaxID=170843 RepID=UPI0031F9D783
MRDDTNPHVAPTQIATPEPDPHFIKSLPPDSGTAPKEKNWVWERAMTNVKNQGKCGCCWAFTIAAVIESHVFIQTKKKESLSPQNLLDCVRNKYGRENSCTKGSMLDAFKYVVEAGGIETDKDYPYQEKQADTCGYNPDKKSATVKDFKRVETGNENLLRDVVGLIGPVACGIDASDNAFRFYKSGIYNSTSCGQTMDSINHSVVIAGYGTEAGLDYWLVKNSWDSTWGDGGYAKIARNSNVCSIATDTYYPIL